jgi:hypothetical protein
MMCTNRPIGRRITIPAFGAKSNVFTNVRCGADPAGSGVCRNRPQPVIKFYRVVPVVLSVELGFDNRYRGRVNAAFDLRAGNITKEVP